MSTKTVNFIKEALLYYYMIDETDRIRCEIESEGYQYKEILVSVMKKGKRKPYNFHHVTLDTFRNQVRVF